MVRNEHRHERPGEAESPPPRDPRRTTIVIALAIAGLAVLVWGYWVFSQADQKPCGQAPQVKVTEVGDLPWLPWLVLVELVWIALMLRKGRLTREILAASLLVLVSLFPGTVIAIETLSCSM